MARIQAEARRNSRNSRVLPLDTSVNISISRSSVSQEPLLPSKIALNQRKVNFTMEKNYEVLNRSAANLANPNDGLSQLSRRKNKRDMAIEERPGKSKDNTKGDRSKRNKKKAKKDGDSDSAISVTPSEFRERKLVHRGITLMKRDRGDSMDSINAAELRKLLDLETVSMISRISRNVSVTQRNDHPYSSKESVNAPPKSQSNWAGAAAGRASASQTARSALRGKSILKNGNGVMLSPSWCIDTGFERFIMKWYLQKASQLQEEVEDTTVADLAK